MGTKTQKLSNVVDQIVEWQSVFTGDGSTGLTAVAGRGYFIDTTSGTVTVTLPASPKIGDTVTIADYATTFATNNVTINPNGNKIEANTVNGILSTNDQTHTLVYTDSTQGWKIINQDTTSSIQPQFVSATGGTVTESGDYKIHTFTGDGCFVVSCGGNSIGNNKVDYLVIAGGAGGGGSPNNQSGGGGGGAGGYRESHSTPVSGCYTASPLATPTSITIATQTYPITVGSGGAGGVAVRGVSGSNSVFSTITSAGGGAGGMKTNCEPEKDPLPGGSGGGGTANTGCALPMRLGNQPPVSPPQGNPGGSNNISDSGGGGGGAGAAGFNANTPAPNQGGFGGTGTTSCITGSPVTRAGGGGGGNQLPGNNGTGGPGGGGNGGRNTPGICGTVNTGSGGGGAGSQGGGCVNGGAGGKGIVIIRYKYQ
jgi:hypothetical protein